jgi:hypothetical protein
LFQDSRQRALYRDEAARLVTNSSAGPLFASELGNYDQQSGTIDATKRVRPWWFTGDNGKLCFSVRYGSRVLDIAKGKNAIEVANLDDLAAVIETVKSAVETGELDAQIEAASGSLKAGFKK